MQEAERRTAEELRAHRPELVEPFLAQLPKARAVALERLVSVLVREGVGAVRTGAARAADDPTADVPESVGLVADVVPSTATGRLSLAAPPLFRRPDGRQRQLTHPVEAWHLLVEHDLVEQGVVEQGVVEQEVAEQEVAEQWQQEDVEKVADDLADSVCHHALALAGAAQRFADDEDGCAPDGSVSALQRARRAPSPLAFFEQSVVDGHPAHHSSKSRRGIASGETPDVSPEWGCRFDAPLVAVALSHVTRASADDAGTPSPRGLVDHLRTEHPDTVAAAQEELRSAGLDPATYELIPAHPWQARAVLPEKFAAHLRARTVVPLAAAIPARPLMSSRTLAPAPSSITPFPAHIKTSVDLRLTMAVRGVSRYAVENGPAMTRLLETVFDREAHFGGRLLLQPERAAAGFLAQAESDTALQSSLGAILRDSPESGLAEGEIALPVAALYSASPSTGELLVGEVLDELVAARRLPSRPEAAQVFADEYADLALPGLLTLLSRYGIALEAHPQNTVLVLRDGAPVRLLVRDLGGARVLPERLRAQGFEVDLRPGSPVIAADERELRDKLHYSLVTNHLGELLAALEQSSGAAQRPLWTPFARAAVTAFDALDGSEKDREALLDAPLPVKTFLRMRLAGAVTDSAYVAGPNPLRPEEHLADACEARTGAEIRIAGFLAGDQPHLLAAFHRNLPRARRQGLAALIANVLREELVSAGPPGDDGVIRVDLPSGASPEQQLEVRVQREFAFGHLQVSEVRIVGQGRTAGRDRAAERGRELTHPVELLDLLERNSPQPWCELTAEVDESTANLAMSYACSVHRHGELSALARRLDATGADQLALRAQRSDPAHVPRLTGRSLDPHLLFDRLCTEGHNLHPWGRSRWGLSPASTFRYAPDCAGEARLALVAVHGDHLLNSTDDEGRDIGELLFDHFPDLGAQARRALSEQLPEQSDVDAYRFVPVHAWQARHKVPTGYAEEIASGIVVALCEPQLPATPTVSLRTVVTEPGRHGRRLVVKTALDVLITTSRRSISPATTDNGPRISRVLDRLVAEDPLLRARARVVRELAGACWQPPGSAGSDEWRRRNLSALCREDPGEHAADDELAITGCALYAPSPVTGRAVLADLVASYRSAQALDPRAAALDVLEQYADLLLTTALTLLVTCGIGLEAHLQNTLVVWRDGRPVRLLLRDFAGIRVHGPRLCALGTGYRPHPESIVVVDDVDTARNRVYYSAVQANLAEIIRTSCVEFGLDELDCWRVVRERADGVFAELARRGGETAKRAEADREALGERVLQQKAFVRTRLEPATARADQQVPNPLRAADEVRTAEASDTE